jgi:hypothetical protein
MLLLDVRHGQTSSDVRTETWCDMVRKWRPVFWVRGARTDHFRGGPSAVSHVPRIRSAPTAFMGFPSCAANRTCDASHAPQVPDIFGL